MNRRSFLSRAVAAVAGASLAAVSRWMPGPKAPRCGREVTALLEGDDFILDEPVHVVPDRDWQWYVDTNVLPPLNIRHFAELESVDRTTGSVVFRKEYR